MTQAKPDFVVVKYQGEFEVYRDGRLIASHPHWPIAMDRAKAGGDDSPERKPHRLILKRARTGRFAIADSTRE